MSITEKQMQEYKEWERKNLAKYGYYLHGIFNGIKDDINGEIDYPFVDGFCDIHTHGLNYINQPEIRIVCDYGGLNRVKILIDSLALDVIEGRYVCIDNSDTDHNLYRIVDGKDELIGQFIKDPDEEDVVRLIRFDVPEEYIEPQYVPLEMLKREKTNN